MTTGIGSTDLDGGNATEAAAADVIDGFVDLFNARDFEALAELLGADVSSDFLDLAGREGVTESLSDMAIRNPGLVLTRGELGEEAVAVAWTPSEEHSYSMLGFLSFSFTDDADPLIDHLLYDDRPGDAAALLAEEPDPDDIQEGGEWEEWEAGGEPG